MICYSFIMGRHKEWRKIAKRERRRLIRKNKAKMRDNILSPSHSGYNIWLKQQEDLDLFEREQIEAVNRVENEKWIHAEKVAIKQWAELQHRKEKLNQIRLEQEATLKMERELEQKRKEEEEKRLKVIEEEIMRKQQAFMEKLEQFLTGDSEDPPAELLVSSETKPNHEPCPFFVKTGCCRFGNQCSRNHQFPGISRIILAANFFTHIGINNALDNDYDADDLLEHEYSETYKDFKEFFYDVLPEFEKHGQILQFKVCNNYEKHLRGNTYIEFAKLRCAVSAYRALHTRWFAGKQLSLQFCRINSWKTAICGLQSTKRCPKGRSCNFLHVFRNPNNLFPLNLSHNQESERKHRTPPRSWRWSESPEVEISRRRRSRSRSRERSRRSSRQDERRRDSKRRRRRSRSRRRSPKSEARK
ncbi:U2 small nuclear ribonucleoprotein auxiliary factor 35 kDa subunit-related protein 2-like [Cydia pomonella]|uniref:U2 small nuclear ribonucleoprotein auxiliary factor 35 kDa subunit-related protein 2-like n=1 Tax=Cydia pomonella TaxID=82600 RepID=UPI002ADD61EA|nr:U2 small nuclear ribonucleoprotein auxiliary factor 35 kDa subunit-related protein 2-like [Cydia pomonella]